jgi:hypothetical protein
VSPRSDPIPDQPIVNCLGIKPRGTPPAQFVDYETAFPTLKRDGTTLNGTPHYLLDMLGGIQAKELALLAWLVTTFAIGTVVYSPLNGLALSVPTTWGLWALLEFRERG